MKRSFPVVMRRNVRARTGPRRALFTRTARAPVRRRAIRGVKGSFAKKVKAVINTTLEKKFLFTRQQTAALNTIPAAINVSDIAQGITDVTRIGDHVTPSSMELSFMFTNTTAFSTYVRVAVVKTTKQALSADYTPLNSLWFTNPTTNDVAAHPTIAFGNALDGFRAKFNSTAVTVVSDKIFKLAKTGETNGSDVKPYTLLVPLKGKINFDTAAGGALNQTVRYYIIQYAYSPQGNAAVATGAQGYIKLRYTDA